MEQKAFQYNNPFFPDRFWRSLSLPKLGFPYKQIHSWTNAIQLPSGQQDHKTRHSCWQNAPIWNYEWLQIKLAYTEELYNEHELNVEFWEFWFCPGYRVRGHVGVPGSRANLRKDTSCHSYKKMMFGKWNYLQTLQLVFGTFHSIVWGKFYLM